MSGPISASRRARADVRSVSRTRPTVAQSQSRRSLPREADEEGPGTTGPPYRSAPDGKTRRGALCELFALAIYQLEGRPPLVCAGAGGSLFGRRHELESRSDGRGPRSEALLEEVADLLGAPPLLGPVTLELRSDRDELVFS